MPSIVALDLETTGFSPKLNDRILEIGAVRVGFDGTILDSFDTLVNPRRDVGPIQVHGITASMIAKAPRFEDVAGDLMAFLAGSQVLAGHNFSFDLRFLKAELARMGVVLPELRTFCSCRELGGLNLNACGDALGIADDGDAHCAVVDARRTARIAAAFSGESPAFLKEFGYDRRILPLPPALDTKRVTRGCASKQAAPGSGFLRSLLGQLRHDPDDAEASEGYLSLLTEVLEDRVVDQGEAAMLQEAAEMFDLNAERVAATHLALLEGLCDAALEDRVVTDAERRDLDRVCELLGEPKERLDPLLAAAARRRELRKTAARPSDGRTKGGVGMLLKGKRVCFSGTLQTLLGGERMKKGDAERLAEEAGLVVQNSVTKKLDILVVADPDSASGKADKARSYGTRIMAEAAFWPAAGVGLRA